jgi:hypothetical protein
MMTRRAWYVSLLTLIIALSISCDHTSPIAAAIYTPPDPLVPGAEAKLALSGDDAHWTSDGSGILYVGGCLQRKAAGAASMRIIPATGGSAIWEMCEDRNSIKQPPDSLTSLSTAALGSDGPLLYAECVWPDLDPLIGCANLGHITIWLADSGRSWGARRPLFDLYHVILGTPPDPPGKLNELVELRWIGATTFLARGFHLSPSSETMLGLVVGTTATNPTLTLLPETDQVVAYSTANDTNIVFFRSDLLVERMPIDGGAAQQVAAVPAAPGRALVDVSCNGSTCLLLTRESIGSAFWRLDLQSNSVSQIRGDAATITLAQRSPRSQAVLVRRPDGYYLYSDVPD